MWFERIVAEGLAHNSYIIGSGGVAAVIDPRRDCNLYLGLAGQHDAVITHVFETHRNEDYVTGAPELHTGAERRSTMVPGWTLPTGTKFTKEIGSRWELWNFQSLRPRGHTEESITLVVTDAEVSREPYMVFSGDTLFSGDIARTDFFGLERKAEMAEKIYDSISRKILPLGDGVILCPTHGAGSACGTTIADHPFSTIGYEKRSNPVLAMGKDAFVSRRTTDSPYLPPYFRQMEIVNQEGPPLLSSLPCPRPLAVPDITDLIGTGCQIVDIRSPTAFAAGHIPGSLSIWRDGISSFAGWFMDYKRPIVIVDDFTPGIEAVLRQFVRMGYDATAGWLAGGFPAWCRTAQPVGITGTCTVQALKEWLIHEKLFLLDVRDRKNREGTGHIAGSRHIFIGSSLSTCTRFHVIDLSLSTAMQGSRGASRLAFLPCAGILT